ncbi:MAG: hypothetical protein P9L99_10055 [Candidatus Lernaella stagnicola]|nr:hypothetical protein [Candidatus Lernaella stagnicola]
MRSVRRRDYRTAAHRLTAALRGVRFTDDFLTTPVAPIDECHAVIRFELVHEVPEN